MNFFKAVFSEEPDPPPTSDTQGSGEHDLDQPDPVHTPLSSAAWSFGSLVKTIVSKSDSVIETYRSDLKEFGSGLKKETTVIREAASRAVKDLPASLDLGASVAQESLESVGQAIDDIGNSVWKSTSQIISHGRETLIATDFDSDSSNYSSNDKNKQQLGGDRGNQVSELKRYSRLDAQVRALQSDVNTYLEEPEDLVNYNEWKSGFDLDKKGEDIGNLIEENEVIDEIYGKLVPSRTDHESFWSRYFYRLHKLKQVEDARAKLVKRTISGDEEEDLSWDFDDEDDAYEPKINSSTAVKQSEEKSAGAATDGVSIENVSTGMKDIKLEDDVKGVAPESTTDGGDKLGGKNRDENVVSNAPETVSDSGNKLDVKFEEKEVSDVKTDNDNGESCKDSDISVVSSQPSMPGDEDIGWDEIEDFESNDENKGHAVGSTSRIDLRKRLSAADQDEDLNWDIEDDDEVVKS